jgi:hypothetical protein
MLQGGCGGQHWHRHSKKLEAASCSKDNKVEEQLHHSTTGEDMLEKPMKRTTWKKLNGPAPQRPSPTADELLAVL